MSLGCHRWVDLGAGASRVPDAAPDAPPVGALREFTRQAHRAAAPAEVLSRLCALCTETLGFQAAATFLLEDSGGKLRVERATTSGDWLNTRNGATSDRLQDLIAGHRRVLVIPTALNGTGRNGEGAAEGPVRAGSQAWTAVLPLRTDGRPLALLAVRGQVRPSEWRVEAIPALLPYVHQAAAALDELLAEQDHREQRRLRLSRILHEVARALVIHSDLTRLLDAVGDAIVADGAWDHVAVFLRDEADGRLRARTLRGSRKAVPGFWDSFAAAERLPGLAATEHALTLEMGIRDDSRPEAAIARAMGLSTLVSAPVIGNDEHFGVLALGAAQPRAVTREECDTAQTIASQLGVAVANARLREEARLRTEEQERAGRELRLLYETSRAVVATLDLEERLRTVAASLMQATQTTNAAIFRMERNGLAPWISVGGTPEEARRFLSLDLSPIHAARLIHLLKKRKAPVVAADTPRDPFAGSGWKEEFGIRSAIWLPLLFQNRITGVALVYRPGEQQQFTPEQLHLARVVSNGAAVALRLSQAYEHERNIAVTLQRGLGPTVAARLQGFDIGHEYHPALQEAHVGGDIYDAFPLPDGRVALLMADVSGKGLTAAVQTTMLKNMLRAYAFEEADPLSVFTRLNRALFHYTEPHLFVTAFFGVLCPRTGAITYSNAGHDCPLLYDAGAGLCTPLDTTGMALGMDANSVYASRRVELGPGDVLLLYTDGVTEARREALFYGRERLEELLVQVARSKPNRIVTSIFRAVRSYAQGDLHDDIALLVVKAKPSWKSLVRS